MRYLMFLIILSLSFSALASVRITDFGISGDLTVLKPEIINARDGEVKLGSAQSCTIFKCKDLRLTLKNETEKVEISIPKDTYLSGISHFDDREAVKEEIISVDSKLKIHAVNHLGEKTVSYELKSYRAGCDSSCSGSSCTRRCWPDHTLCWKNTKAPTILELIIADVASGEVAAKFISQEKRFERTEKVLKHFCRE